MRVLDEKLIRISESSWELIGQKCADCQKVAFPRKRVCPRCFSTNLDEQLLSKQGTLHTYTTTYLGSPTLPTPYSLGFVDLPEGIKLMGMFRKSGAEQNLEVGMPVHLVLDVLRTDPDGEPVYSYLFAPGLESGQ